MEDVLVHIFHLKLCSIINFTKSTTTLFTRSFRRRFFTYHHAVKHPHKSIIMIKYSFSPKMCRTNFDNRLTNKNVMSKNVFEQGFCIGKGDNPNIFNFRFWQTFGPLLTISYNLVLIFGIFNKSLELLFFSRKIVTSLANNFSMQKSLFKHIFGHYIFICKPIFKFFAAHFRTNGMLNHDKIIFI